MLLFALVFLRRLAESLLLLHKLRELCLHVGELVFEALHLPSLLVLLAE